MLLAVFFRLRPDYLIMSDELADVAIASPDGAASSDAVGQSSSPIAETSEQVAGGVTTSDGEQVQEVDPLEGIPTLEELQTEAERGVPYSKALAQLRAEYERVKPIEKEFQPWKEILADQTPDRVKEQLGFQDQFFSPLVKDGQPVYDDRQLPQTTAQPFLESMEARQPGFSMNHFLDIVDFPATNPTTGQKEPLIAQFFRDVLGLDANKLEQYQQIDTLIAKTNNGSITPEELAKVPDTDQEVYKTLPSGLRKDWEFMDEETRRFHLDGAKERMEARAWREQLTQAQQQAEQSQRQQFEAKIEQTFLQDLTQTRTQAFTSLRDNLARDWKPSEDEAVNRRYYNDVISPLKRLIDPDLQQDALEELEADGIKVDLNKFNEDMVALVGARQTYIRAQAYKDGVTADRALRDFNRLQTQMMAKFNTITLARAQKYGMQAQQIAEDKGKLLTTASAVRPNISANTSVGQGTAGWVDPRSSQAAMADWEQSRLGQSR
jgi:hypothetical protein